jgi:hypothetical protein
MSIETHTMCAHCSYQIRFMLILALHSIEVAIRFCPCVDMDEPRFRVMLIHSLFALTI